MKLFFDPHRRSRGQAAILLALTSVALFLVVFLALDGAHLYLNKVKLQAAIDAAAVSGVTTLVNIVQRGGDPDIALSQQLVEKNSKELAAYNMKEMGLKSESITATAEIEPLSRRMSLDVRGTILSRTFIMGIIGKKDILVSSHAIVHRNPAIISLVLDVSGSMSEANKMPEMKKAAKLFVETMQVNVDQMALIVFDLDGKVEVPMALLTPFNKSQILAAIDGLDADGFTNISEGMHLARKEIEKTINANQIATARATKTIVFMTDGAPNVLRGKFLKPKPALGPDPAPPTYEYYANTKDNLMVFSTNPSKQACKPISACLEDFS